MTKPEERKKLDEAIGAEKVAEPTPTPSPESAPVPISPDDNGFGDVKPASATGELAPITDYFPTGPTPRASNHGPEVLDPLFEQAEQSGAIHKVKLADLTNPGDANGTPHQEQLDRGIVQDYEKNPLSGKPIRVLVGADGSLSLWDGRHRAAAAKDRGDGTIDAVLVEEGKGGKPRFVPSAADAAKPKRAPATPTAAIWSDYQSATGRAKEYLGAALHNAGVHNPENRTTMPRHAEELRLASNAAGLWQDAAKAGHADAQEAVGRMLGRLGAAPMHEAGAAVPFDGAYYDAPVGGGIATGDAVRVTVPAVVLRKPAGTEGVLRKGEVEKV